MEDRVALSVWASDLLSRSIVSFTQSCETTVNLDPEFPQVRRLKQIVQDGFRSVKPFSRTTTAEEFRVRLQDVRRENEVASIDRLVRTWICQSLAWDAIQQIFWVRKVEVPGSTESSSRLVNECQRAVKFLKSRMAAFDRDEANNRWPNPPSLPGTRAILQEVCTHDAYLVELLNSVVDELEMNNGDNATCQVADYEWLGGPEDKFLKQTVFWPCPRIAEFISTSKLSLSGIKILDFETSDRHLIIPAKICGVIKSLRRSSTPNATDSDYESFLTDLLKNWIATWPSEVAGEILARIVSFLFRDRSQWNEDSDWPMRACSVAATSILPDMCVVPPISEQGVDFDAAKKLTIVGWYPETEGQSCAIRPDGVDVQFGIENVCDPQITIHLTGHEPRIWREWDLADRIGDPMLRREFGKISRRRCAGKQLTPLPEVFERLNSGDEGVVWFHGLVEGARGQIDQLSSLMKLLDRIGVGIYPPVDAQTGEAILPDDLTQFPLAERLPPDFSGAANRSGLLVTRFASKPESACFSYAPPLRREYIDLFEKANRLDVSDKFSNALAAVHHADVDFEETDPGQIACLFKALSDDIRISVELSHVTAEELNDALNALQRLGASLDPPVAILPSLYRFGSACVLKDIAEATFDYDYSDVDRGFIAAVEGFGVSVGDTQIPALVTISAGHPINGWASAKHAIDKLPNLLNREEIRVLFGRLPKAEAVENDHGDSVYGDLLKLLWPEVSDESEAEALSANAELKTIRDWFRRAVEGRQRFRVMEPQRGEYVPSEDWRLGETYVEANADQYANAERVRSVVRPLLRYFNTENVWEKAIIYVTE